MIKYEFIRCKRFVIFLLDFLINIHQFKNKSRGISVFIFLHFAAGHCAIHFQCPTVGDQWYYGKQWEVFI